MLQQFGFFGIYCLIRFVVRFIVSSTNERVYFMRCLSSSEREELNAVARTHKAEGLKVRRATAVLPLDSGHSPQLVAEILPLSLDTVRHWRRAFPGASAPRHEPGVGDQRDRYTHPGAIKLMNRIERLWGVMHQNVTHNRFHRDVRQFTEAIDAFINETLPQMREKFLAMVTDNFRVITHDEHRLNG